jgi:hypothetical protein
LDHEVFRHQQSRWGKFLVIQSVQGVNWKLLIKMCSRVLLSQDRHEIFLIIAEYNKEYIAFLDNKKDQPYHDRNTFLSMHKFGPFKIANRRHIERLASFVGVILTHAVHVVKDTFPPTKPEDLTGAFSSLSLGGKSSSGPAPSTPPQKPSPPNSGGAGRGASTPPKNESPPKDGDAGRGCSNPAKKNGPPKGSGAGRGSSTTPQRRSPSQEGGIGRPPPHKPFHSSPLREGVSHLQKRATPDPGTRQAVSSMDPNRATSDPGARQTLSSIDPNRAQPHNDFKQRTHPPAQKGSHSASGRLHGSDPSMHVDSTPRKQPRTPIVGNGAVKNSRHS